VGRVAKRRLLDEERRYLSKGCKLILNIIQFGASQFNRTMEQLHKVQQVTKVVRT